MLVVLIGVIAVVGIVIYFATASQANSEKAASQCGKAGSRSDRGGFQQ